MNTCNSSCIIITFHSKNSKRWYFNLLDEEEIKIIIYRINTRDFKREKEREKSI